MEPWIDILAAVHCQCFHQQTKLASLVPENLMGVVGDHFSKIKIPEQ